MNFGNILQELKNKYSGLGGIRVFLEDTGFIVAINVSTTDKQRTIGMRFSKPDLLLLLDCKTFLSNKIESLISQVLSVKSVPKKKALTSYNSIW